MAAPRKPSKILVMSGAVRHDPQRYRNRTSEPKPQGALGVAPKHLDEKLKAVWKEVIQQVPAGVLTSADRIIVEIVVRLTQKMRHDSISTGEVTQLISGLARLGLTPADRSRVQVDPSQGKKLVSDSPFSQFVPAN